MPFPRNPAAFALGLVVGAWRVVGRGGRGSYGIVYCVQRSEHPEAGLFALKLALDPGDERFEREVELLSRLEHPHAPRLRDSGWWTSVDGVAFPFLVMDWVEGVHLYQWAWQRKLSFQQVARVLAQVARALEALHAMGGVHRDVKGDNVLVTEEGRAVLTDFGLGTYPGARALTRQAEPLGTPQYLSPQALHHRQRFWRRAEPRYEAGPTDDVYALGVTAWRLVTGAYPPGEGVSPELMSGTSPELGALICRLLAEDPAARGSVGAVAQALEEVAETAERTGALSIPRRAADDSSVGSTRWVPARRMLGWGLGLSAAVVGLLVALNTGGMQHFQPVEGPAAVAQETRSQDKPDAGTAGTAEAVRATHVEGALPVSEQEGLSLDLSKNPLPGQRRPPCGKREIEINGGCWVFQVNMEPPCGPRIYEWKQGCYLPTFDPQIPPTSDPP
jgi:hypothetical protein